MTLPLSGLIARLEQRFKAVTFANTLLPTAAALAAQFITFALTARGLGVQQFGVYTVVLAIAAVGVDLTGLGGSDVLVRGVARDRSMFGRYYGHMVLLLIGTLPFVVMAGAALAAGLMQLALTVPLLLAALFAEVLVARAAASLELVMIAHSHTARAGWLRLGNIMVRLIAAVGYFVIAGRHGLAGWIELLCAIALGVVASYHQLAMRLYGSPIWKLRRADMVAGSVLCLTHVAASVQTNVDRMVLTRFAPVAQVGMYGAATRVLQVGLFPIQVATRITYPKFFEARHGGLTGLRAYAMRISIPLLAVGIASAVCVMIASSVLPLVLGRGFAQSVNIAMLLSLGLPFVALQSPPGDVLVAAHQHTLRAAIYWGSAVIFAIVLLVGVLLGGTTGLALGYVGGQATLAVALWVAVFRCKPVAPKPSLPGLDGPMIDETAAI